MTECEWWVFLRGRRALVLNLHKQCRKSMARIKYVMNERRLAYQGAVTLAEEEKTDYIAKVVLEQQLAEHEMDSKDISLRRKRAQTKAAQRARLAAKEIEAAELKAQAEQPVQLGAQPEQFVQSEAQSEQVVQSEAQPDQPKLGEPNADAIVDAAEAQIPVEKSEQAPPKPLPSTKSDRAEATEAVTAGLFGSRGRQRRR